MNKYEFLDLKCLLGEFYPYYEQRCRFARSIRGVLSIAEAYEQIEEFKEAKIYYDLILGYIEAISADDSGNLRRTEFAPISFKELVDGSDVKNAQNVVKNYLSDN